MYETDENINDDDCDLFKPTYKFYKAKKPIPDLSEVLDFEKERLENGRIKEFELTINHENKVHLDCFKPVKEWKAYSINSNPGFIFIVNPFKDGYQKYWVHRCLSDYPDVKNKANLDIQLDAEKRAKLWENFVDTDPETLHKNDEIMGLRWTTLGYHYVWSNKEYHKERRTPMPEDLEMVSKYVAQAIAYPQYCPEAGIVNYYHLDSTLGGHTDHAEFEQGAPLISFSFGQDAIFLLGGLTKEVKPTPMFLRSGDICVMWKESRLAYHGIPKIMPPKFDGYPLSLNSELNENIEHNSSTDSDETLTDYKKRVDNLNKNMLHVIKTINWKSYKLYMSCSRINLNTRQVCSQEKTFS